METRHEKNVQRKLRVKERNNAIAESLRSEPLRSINTCGLRALQRALGLPLDPCFFPEGVAQADNYAPARLDQIAGSGAGQSNSPITDIPPNKSTAGAVTGPTIPAPEDFDRQEPELLDAIFIAIDFEYSHHSPKTGRIRLREVGISMLDTRDLCHQNICLKDIISSQHYRTVTDTKKFLFGKSVDILQDDLVLVLKRLLYLEDVRPKQTRDLILVGHGFGFEIKAMKGLGLDLNLAPSVVEIFDTEFLGYEVFGKEFKSSLSNVVRKTGISGGFYHNAGNDANFSLRAMFLLACHGYDTLEKNSSLKLRPEMYKKVAKS